VPMLCNMSKIQQTSLFSAPRLTEKHFRQPFKSA